jgi:electron transfer flavoprotein alpha subunit
MVLVFAESNNGTFKKASLEVVQYASKVAALLGTTTTAIVLGEANEVALLGNYGANKVIHMADNRLAVMDSKVYAKVLASVATEHQATVSGAISLPDTNNGFCLKKGVFAGKAFANVSIHSPIKVISITPNSFPIEKSDALAEVVSATADIQDSVFAIKVESVQKVSGIVPLSEAELVVSGGRGLKGPENWGILEDMASSIGATLACSRPVADSHWRPHHEHVGQTGGTIRPNLYVAVGISGAIQHLAGVNSSKTIVVINKDAEAPFFKAADYGVLGDAFEVVPRLTEAFKKFKATQNA